MIHAVQCFKYCQVLSCMFELILSSDDSLQLSLIAYEMFQGSVLFLLGLLEQTRQAEEKGRHRSLGMCQKMRYLGANLATSFKDSSNMLVFSFLSLSTKR